MNYNGSINEMDMSDFIEHYSAENSNVSILHSAKGTTWSKKNAKYVKRVKINGKWRYYYKEIKESVNKGIEKAKSFFQNIYDKVKNSSLVKKLTKDRKDKIDSIKENHAEEPLSKLKKKAEYTLKSVEYRKEYKYYQRVRLPNGKWRYFYSQKEYEMKSLFLSATPYQSNVSGINKKLLEDDSSVVKGEILPSFDEFIFLCSSGKHKSFNVGILNKLVDEYKNCWNSFEKGPSNDKWEKIKYKKTELEREYKKIFIRHERT